VESAAGTLNMLRLQYHSVRLSLPFLSLCVVGLTVPLSDILTTVQRLRTRAAAFRRQGRLKFALFLGVLRRTLSALILGLAVVAVGHQLSIHVWQDVDVDLLLTACDVFLAGVLLVWSVPLLSHHRRIAFLAGLSLLIAVGWGCDLASTRWHAGFSEAYNRNYHSTAFTSMTRIAPDRERLCICDNTYYPFFGSRREFNVCRPLWLPDSASFVQYVRESEASIVVTRKNDVHEHRRYVHVADWISRHSDIFEKIGGDYVYTWARVINVEENQPASSNVAPE